MPQEIGLCTDDQGQAADHLVSVNIKKLPNGSNEIILKDFELSPFHMNKHMQMTL